MTQQWSNDIRQAWQEGMGPGRLRQHANESPWEVPDPLRAQIVELLAELPFGRYDFALRPLVQQALSRYSGVAPEQIIPGNGADELIQLSMMAFTAPTGRVVIATPTFFVYTHTAASLRLEVCDVPLIKPGFGLNVAGLCQTVRSGDLVFICRPNNPTGNVFAAEDVLAVLDHCEACGATAVLDEAYYEFCGQTLVNEITGGRRSRLVILRTLSKAFRLAGLRLGYALLTEPLVDALERVRLAYNLSAASMVAALGVLSRPSLAKETAAAIAELRQTFASDLSEIPGLTVYPSEANFIMTDLPCPAAPVHQRLAEQGMLLRHFPGSAPLERTLRLTVGERDDNAAIVAALAKALTAVGSAPSAGKGR